MLDLIGPLRPVGAIRLPVGKHGSMEDTAANGRSGTLAEVVLGRDRRLPRGNPDAKLGLLIS
jgi:hypothetical protein